MKRIANQLSRLLLPRLGDMLILGTFLAVIGLGGRLLNVDGDLGRHLTIGGHILDTWRIPTRDLFSHTMSGEPMTPHEWLAQVIFALAYRWMGLNGVVLLCAVLLMGAFGITYRDALRRSGLPLASLVICLLALAASSLHWLARPHLFTILLLPVWVTLMEALRQGKRWPVWAAPLTMLAWANLHGAFIAGFVTWLAYAGGWVWERLTGTNHNRTSNLTRLLAAGVLSALATLVNPSGLKLWGTSVGYLRNSYLVGHTAEYLSPDFHQVSTWPFLALLFLAFMLFGLARGRVPASSVFLISGWAAMAMVSARNIPLFALVSAPVFTQAAGDALAQSGPARLTGLESRLAGMEKRLIGGFWPTLGVVLVLLAYQRGIPLDAGGAGNRFDPQVFPVQAVDWLEENPQQGEVFNYFPWGGYLLYRLWPERTVFIDGQTDFYGEALTRQYEQVLTVSPGWEEVLEKFNIGWTILPPDTPIARALGQSPGWRAVYQDNTSVILRRETQ